MIWPQFVERPTDDGSLNMNGTASWQLERVGMYAEEPSMFALSPL